MISLMCGIEKTMKLLETKSRKGVAKCWRIGGEQGATGKGVQTL